MCKEADVVSLNRFLYMFPCAVSTHVLGGWGAQVCAPLIPDNALFLFVSLVGTRPGGGCKNCHHPIIAGQSTLD